MERSRNWCFTLNNPTIENEEDILALPHAGLCDYVCYGRETGSMGTYHLQGFVNFNSLKSLKQVMELGLGHVTRMYSTQAQAMDYCKKDMDWMEAGRMPMNPAEKGQACKDLYKGCWDAAKEGRLDDIPESIRFRHIKAIEHIQAKYGRHLPPCPDIELKDWQEELYEHLQNEPDSRKILIIIDKEGGQGKSTFCRWLLHKIDGVELFSGGTSKDIAYALKSPKVALFDFARCLEEHRPWNIVEQVKNGAVFNSKYESGMNYFPIPHVVVFTNQDVEEGKLSEDRIWIKDITPPIVYKHNCLAPNKKFS